MNIITPEQIAVLKTLGTEWEAHGKHRIYFNDLAEYVGLDCDYYNTGNVSSARLNGEKISNTRASAMLSQLNSGKIWFDYADSKFYGKGMDAEFMKTICAAIRAKAGIQKP